LTEIVVAASIMPRLAARSRRTVSALPVLGLSLGLILATLAIPSARAAVADASLSALLKKQTQEFSDAGQRGDAATLARLLDDDVVFTVENGSIITKKDIVGGAKPDPTADQRKIEVTDWQLHRQGDVAIGTFIDVLTMKAQNTSLSFQSTEIWAKRKDGWKMIASHTMTVPRDPPAIDLPPAELDAYVGTYRSSTGAVAKISRAADGLVMSTNGGEPAPIKVELKDVLFTPGLPQYRRLFQRDASGSVIGYVTLAPGADVVVKKIE